MALLTDVPDISGFTLTGCNHSMFANRISYQLDLKGPSYAINTACSSAAMAMHQAIVNIESGQCEAAIVGGVNLHLQPQNTMTFKKLNMLSEDYRCKFLDKSADGYVKTEGCTVIVLQKASEAKRCYASVVNIGANVDGYKVQGITYPSLESQSILMRSTLEQVNVNPNDIYFMEVHGTGTQAGDQCEMSAIANAYCVNRSSPLMVGSVKNKCRTFGNGICTDIDS